MQIRMQIGMQQWQRQKVDLTMGESRKMSKIAKIITGEKEKSHRWRQKHRKMAEKVLKLKTFSQIHFAFQNNYLSLQTK